MLRFLLVLVRLFNDVDAADDLGKHLNVGLLFPVVGHGPDQVGGRGGSLFCVDEGKFSLR